MHDAQHVPCQNVISHVLQMVSENREIKPGTGVGAACQELGNRAKQKAGTLPGLQKTLPRTECGYLTRSTCSNSSSTGVARPKMETETFTRPFSKSSSSTIPLKLAKGPSSTLTASPIS